MTNARDLRHYEAAKTFLAKIIAERRHAREWRALLDMTLNAIGDGCPKCDTFMDKSAWHSARHWAPEPIELETARIDVPISEQFVTRYRYIECTCRHCRTTFKVLE